MYRSGDGSFDERGTVSRLEFTLSVVDRLYGNADKEGCFRSLAPSSTARFTRLFPDVSVDEWYAPSLCVGMRAGLIQGYANGMFRPFAPINAAEASKILARAYGLATHAGRMPWYASYLAAMQSHGAMVRNIAPESNIQRTGMARMFYTLRNERSPELPVGAHPLAPNNTDAVGSEPWGIPLPVMTNTNEESASTSQSDGCPIARVNSPGTALLILGIEAHPRTLERRSHRILEIDAGEAYRTGTATGPDGGRPASDLLNRCDGAFVNTPGGGLMFLGSSIPRTVIERIPHRWVRAAAQQRGQVDDFRIDRNVGY